MTRLQIAEPERLRVIMCMAFDRRAPFEKVDRFKQCIIRCPFVVQSIQLTGTFDFMVEATFKCITEYQQKLDSLAEIIASLVARYEANFVCAKYLRENDSDGAIWVPCHQGLQRLDCSMIDMIQAEGDYVRVHSSTQSWLKHSTLRNMFSQLTPGEFVCVHRSLILRCAYIERMLHEGRRWVARLQSGERKNVARSQVRAVLQTLGIDPANVRQKASTTADASKTDQSHRRVAT